MDATRREEIENFAILAKRDIGVRRINCEESPGDKELATAAKMLFELLAEIKRLESSGGGEGKASPEPDPSLLVAIEDAAMMDLGRVEQRRARGIKWRNDAALLKSARRNLGLLEMARESAKAQPARDARRLQDALISLVDELFADPDGLLDSGRSSSGARAMELLAEIGELRVIWSAAGRVVGVWKEEGEK